MKNNLHPIFSDGTRTSIPIKTLILLMLLAIQFTFAIDLKAQEYLWHKHFSGSGSNNVTGLDVTTDAAGNIYAVGRFAGTVNFGGLSLTSKSASGDIFYLKMNSAGTPIFARNIGGINGNCSGTGLAVFKDASNNVFLYVSGYFTSDNGTIISVNFDPANTQQGIRTMNDLQGDAFVAKYNVTTATPIFVWATVVPNSRADYTNGGHVATDGTGNLYMASKDASLGCFLRKFNANTGAQIFANNICSIGAANDIAFKGGNVFVCGSQLTSSSRPIAWFTSDGAVVSSTGATNRNFRNMAFDNGTGIYGVGEIVDAIQGDVIIEKYTTTTSSTPVWNRFFYSGINGWSIDVAYGGSATGDILVSGWFKGTVDFNSPGSSPYTLTSSGAGLHDNIFVARYYASSGNPEWVKNNTSSTSSGQSNPLALTTSQQSVVVLSSVVTRTVNASFCGNPVYVNSDNGSSSFIAAYSQRLFAPVISGPSNTLPGERETYYLSATPGANTYEWMVPPGWNIVYYGPDKVYMEVNVGNNSGNVQTRAIYDCGPSTVANLYVTVGSGGHLVSIYPNPVSEILTVDTNAFAEPTSIVLRDGNGTVLRSATYDPIKSGTGLIQIDVATVPTGIYYLSLATAEQITSSQVSISH